jgi:hypothetical protein
MLKLNLYFAGDDYDKIYSKSQLLPIIIGYHIAQYVKRPNTTLTHAIEDMLHINLASYHTENRSKLNQIPRESCLKAARIALLAYVQFVKGVDHVDLEFDVTDFKLKLVREELLELTKSDFPSPCLVKSGSGDTIILELSPEDVLTYLEYYNLLLDPSDIQKQNHITIPMIPYTGPQYVKRSLSRHICDITMTILDSPLANIIYES